MKSLWRFICGRMAPLKSSPSFPSVMILIGALGVVTCSVIWDEWLTRKLGEEWVDTSLHIFYVICAASLVHVLDRLVAEKRMVKVRVEEDARIVGEFSDLVRQCHTSGIRKIYQNREDVYEELKSDMQHCKKRALFIGVTLKDIIADIIKLGEKQEPWRGFDGNNPQALPSKTLDLRVLLLNPLKSPGLFRAVLESDQHLVKAMMDHSEKKLIGGSPYESTTLYGDFTSSFSRFDRNAGFHGRIKFYAHTPACWLVLLDDVAYFQPYTFGNLKLHSHVQMPVFKLELRAKKNDMFEALIEHFDRLWVTSNIDTFHMGFRRDNKEMILSQMYGERENWFRHIMEELYPTDVRLKERAFGSGKIRKFVRMPCDSSPPGFEVVGGNGQRSPAKILNSSCGGLGIALCTAVSIAEGDEVHLCWEKAGITTLAQLILEDLTNMKSDNLFTVKRAEGNRIGIEPIPRSDDPGSRRSEEMSTPGETEPET